MSKQESRQESSKGTGEQACTISQESVLAADAAAVTITIAVAVAVADIIQQFACLSNTNWSSKSANLVIVVFVGCSSRGLGQQKKTKR